MADVINSAADTYGLDTRILPDGSWSFLGPNFDVTAANIGQMDALHLNFGISLARTMAFGNVDLVFTGSADTYGLTAATSMTFTSPILHLASAGIRISGTLSGPPAGLFNVLVDGSGNVSFSNVANGGGGGTAFEVGGNSGLTDPAIFGTLDAVGIDHKVNGQSYLTVSSGTSVVLCPAGTSNLTIGYTGLPVNFFADNFTMSCNGGINMSCVGPGRFAPGGNLLLESTGVGSTQTFGNAFHLSNLFGSSVVISADSGSTSVDCFTTLSLGLGATAINMGSAAAVSTIDGTNLSIPNLPTSPGGATMKPVIVDTANGRFYVSP